ncbi:hypothetical protein [Peristeroidobacter soli]|uniref:hypothetical protein n=1 Tax=Peristeroidobacter soli TaxID=2497877 RepID=UPI00101DF980|nr:hypothetical protein [Peristeroidobacter soli]
MEVSINSAISVSLGDKFLLHVAVVWITPARMQNVPAPPKIIDPEAAYSASRVGFEIGRI